MAETRLGKANPVDFTDAILQNSLKLVRSSYSLPVPKSISEEIVKQMSSFLQFEPFTKMISEITRIALETRNKELLNISTNMSAFQASLSNFNTDTKITNYLREGHYFNEPSSININLETQIPRNLQSCVTVKIGQVFKTFFECDNILNLASKFQNYCISTTGTLFHFLQSPMWRNLVIQNGMKMNVENTILMPIFLYYDDYESKNPLGSHKGSHKLGGIYLSIPSFPPELESKIGNIFLAGIFHTILKNHVGYAELFSWLVEALNLLNSNGISVHVNGKIFNIKFQVGQVLGDNLGLNSLGGFVESFSANYYCRLCKAPNDICKTLCSEAAGLSRTRENYTSDIFCCDPSATGLKELSFLNKVPNFHVVDHLTLDVMHDIMEGIARYEIILIVANLISLGYFTLDTLNTRLLAFKFGTTENRPPPFTKDCLSKNMLLLSASEMYCFVAYFGLMVGDLVPRHNKYWELYTLLRQITAISMSFHVKTSAPDHLASLISSHHKLYLDLVDGSALKPKHHFVTHYPKKLQNVGPLRALSSFRYEALHKKFKATAKNSANTRNLPFTLANKFQMDLAFRQKCTPLIPEQVILGCSIDFSVETSLYLDPDNEMYLRKYNQLLHSKLFHNYGYVQFRCFEYRKDHVVITNFDEQVGPVFSVIECIISDGVQCYFLAKKLHCLYFDTHYQAYKVERLKNVELLDANDLAVKRAYMLMSNALGDLFVCPKTEL
jgi:hypothetical protein